MQQRDGHALLFTFISALTVAPLLHARLPFDPAEIAPISIGAGDWLTIAAPNTPPVASLGDAVAAIRAQPGRFNWASGGGDAYLSMLGFVRQQGLEMQYVAYRAPTLALPDLTQGRLQLLMLPLAAALPLARGGQLRLLAVTNPERSPAAPDVPTVAEAGFADLTFQGTLAFFAPRAMQPNLRERIAADIVAIAGDPGLRERLAPLGMMPRSSAPAELQRLVAENHRHWAERARVYGVLAMN
jgi:tripartite-type tricarboxylate transporter receptor subunit TctC